MSKIEAYMTDERYPILVIKNANFIRGYHVNSDTGELTQVCVCAAHSNTECICGAWDISDDVYFED